DVGFRTTDLAALEDGEFIPEKSRTIAVGLAAAYAEIADHLLTRYGLERESHALDEAVITGRIRVAGREVDITDIRNQAFKELAAKVLVELHSTWRVLEFDRLLVSGGGGQALSNYLLPHLSHAELVPDPVTANCKGYLAWARRLWK
ncbi:MAG: ParM/StbA family protein, partial [Bacillota bacterium]